MHSNPPCSWCKAGSSKRDAFRTAILLRDKAWKIHCLSSMLVVITSWSVVTIGGSDAQGVALPSCTLIGAEWNVMSQWAWYHHLLHYRTIREEVKHKRSMLASKSVDYLSCTTVIECIEQCHLLDGSQHAKAVEMVSE